MLFLDTSALIKRYVEEEGTAFVLERMEEDQDWVVSSLAPAEAEITLCRLGFEPTRDADRSRRLGVDLERCLMVPVDRACLDRGAEIGCRYDLRTLDALHLAAADRLPRPFTILTFDKRQADAGRSMGLVVDGA